MPSYHLLSTRRNPDGSYATPSIDEVLAAPDAASAVHKARRFPLRSFDNETDVAWLVDETGTVLWSQDLDLPDAA